MKTPSREAIVISDDDSPDARRPSVIKNFPGEASGKPLVIDLIANEVEPRSKLEHPRQPVMTKPLGIMDQFARSKKVAEKPTLEEYKILRMGRAPQDRKIVDRGSHQKAALSNSDAKEHTVDKLKKLPAASTQVSIHPYGAPDGHRSEYARLSTSATSGSAPLPTTSQNITSILSGAPKSIRLDGTAFPPSKPHTIKKRDFLTSDTSVMSSTIRSDNSSSSLAVKNSIPKAAIVRRQHNGTLENPRRIQPLSLSNENVSRAGSSAKLGNSHVSDASIDFVRDRSKSQTSSLSEVSSPSVTPTIVPEISTNSVGDQGIVDRTRSECLESQQRLHTNQEVIQPVKPISPPPKPNAESSGESGKDCVAQANTDIQLMLREDRARAAETGNLTAASAASAATKSPTSMQSPVASKQESMSRSDIERCLEDLYQLVKDEVALTTMYSLHDARELNKKSITSRFIDKKSPWSEMTQVTASSNITKPTLLKFESRIMERTNNHNTKLKPVITSTLVAKTIRDQIPSVPKFVSTTFVKRNFLTADDEVLHYVPYFAENDSTNTAASHKRLVKDLEASYSNLGLSTRESELSCQIREHLDNWLPRVGLTNTILQRYFLDRRNQDIKLHRALIKLILKDLGGPLPNAIARQARDFADSFKSVFDIELSDVILPEAQFKDFEKTLKTSANESSPEQDTFGTFASWMCLICGVPYCQVHGDYEHNYMYGVEKAVSKDDSYECKYVYDYRPLGLNIHDLLHNGVSHIVEEDARNERSTSASLPDQLRPCTGDLCWLRAPNDISKSQELIWPVQKLDLLKEFATIFINKNTRSCIIAAGINMPCHQIHLKLREIEDAERMPSSPELRTPRRTQDRPLWYNNDKKTLHHNWHNMTDAQKHEERSQLDTCAHEGPCNADNCGCFTKNILCERWCLCAPDCGRRFTGCSCLELGLACTQESCICVQMHRECGPECGTCGAVARLDPYNKFNEELFRSGCQNVAIQRGVPKRMIIGESTLEGVGFGAYLAEPVQKGGYIGEYIGEATTFKESERRAIIYERKHSSFLFDINSEWTLDAARHGNKTRFINHAPNEAKGLNCCVRVLLANGEHHIKIFALKDIKPGEELFFDYGIKFTESHLREKLDAESKKKTNGGALTTQEALDALDGLGGDNRATRKKMAQIRGGKSGTSTKKARASKSATIKKVEPKKVIVEEIAGSDESDADSHQDEADVSTWNQDEESGDEEEEDEEMDKTTNNAQTGRPKRSVQKPSRYTR